MSNVIYVEFPNSTFFQDIRETQYFKFKSIDGYHTQNNLRITRAWEANDYYGENYSKLEFLHLVLNSKGFILNFGGDLEFFEMFVPLQDFKKRLLSDGDITLRQFSIGNNGEYWINPSAYLKTMLARYLSAWGDSVYYKIRILTFYNSTNLKPLKR